MLTPLMPYFFILSSRFQVSPVLFAPNGKIILNLFIFSSIPADIFRLCFYREYAQKDKQDNESWYFFMVK